MPYEVRKCPACRSVEYEVLDAARGVYKCAHCGVTYERVNPDKSASGDLSGAPEYKAVESARELTEAEKAELARLSEAEASKRREIAELDARYILPAIVLTITGCLLIVGFILAAVGKLPFNGILFAVVGGLCIAGLLVSAARMTAVALVQSRLTRELDGIKGEIAEINSGR